MRSEQNTKPFVLYLGQRRDYKNFPRVLEAFAAWRHNNEVSLCVVGPAWSADELAVLSSLDLRERVIALGHVADSTLADLYNKASAFIYPSLHEGFGLPLLEAMAAGCPIIASNIPSTREVAGDYPMYFEPTSTEDLISSLSVALDKGRNFATRRMGVGIVSRYSWDTTARLTVKCYRDVWKG
jgi:glycosyltransferase involved in cell wall biosynthesis